MDWLTDSDYLALYGSTPGKEFPPVGEGVAYNEALCNFARQQGMRCMAKNTGETTFASGDAGGGGFDGSTFESYPDQVQWWAPSFFQGFLDESKPVVIVHYGETDEA